MKTDRVKARRDELADRDEESEGDEDQKYLNEEMAKEERERKIQQRAEKSKNLNYNN